MALPRLITTKELLEKIPYSLAHIGKLEAEGKFPARVRLGEARVGWIEEEVESWLANKERGPHDPSSWHRWSHTRPDAVA